MSADDLDVCDPEHALQFACWNRHRSGVRCSPRCRLRECGRHRRVKRDVALNLLHDLMNVAVQNGHRTKAFEKGQRLRAVGGAPAPLLIDHPQRNVREDHDRRRRTQAREISLQPRELLRAQVAHCINLYAIVQADKVNAFVVVAVPAVAHRSFAEPLQIQRAIIEGKIMLTRNIEDLSHLRTLNHLRSGVELRSLRVLGDVTCVDHEVWQLRPCRDRVDPVDGFLQRSAYIGIRALVESDVTIADLDKGEFLCLPDSSRAAFQRLSQ